MRMARAYKKAGPEAVAGFWQVLLGIVDDDELNAVLEHIKQLEGK